MIDSREEYREFVKRDFEHMSFARTHSLSGDPIWKFLKNLRRCEYYKNCKSGLFKPIYYFYRYLLEKQQRSLNFSIPLNTIGAGLSIPHYGTIIIASEASIGEGARIHAGVNIGGTDAGFPKIGNNVYIGPGAKIFGPIVIGDNVKIGANAVVNKSFPEGNCTLVGVPAKAVNIQR